MKTRIFSILAALVVAFPVVGQDFQNGYFLGGYNAAFRMNPAIQNERSIFAIGLGNIGIGSTSNQLGAGTFLYNVNGERVNAYDRRISADTFLGKLSKGSNNLGLNMNLDVLTLGFWSKRNYITIDVRARADLQASYPYDLYVLMKTPQSGQSLDLSGTALGLNGILETAVGFSHNFDNRFNLGGRFKLLYGVLSTRIMMDSMTATYGTDKWTFNGHGTMDSSSPGFRVKTDDDGFIDVESILDDIDPAGLKKPAGFGAAIDLGATWNVLPWLTLSGAILDIGTMRWNREVFGETPSSYEWEMVPDDDGFVDGTEAIGTLMSFKSLSSPGAAFSMMPLTFNLGAEAAIPGYDRLSFGILGTVRHSQVCNWAESRLSANWTPGDALSLSLSSTLNNFGQFLGFALNLHPGGINLFFGTDYIPLRSKPLSFYEDVNDLPGIVRNLGIPTDRLNMNLYFGLNLAFGNRHLDYRRRIVEDL